MIELLRPFLSRIIGGGVAMLAAFLAAKFGVVLDETAQAAMIASGVAIVFAIVHKLLDRWINPGDDADPALVEASRSHARAIRRGGLIAPPQQTYQDDPPQSRR